MGLVSCKSCGNEVSTKAKACPKCGAPRSTGMGVGKVLLLIVVGLMVVSAVGASAKHDREKEAVSQGTSAINVSADQLQVDYQANEVSADNQYKGKVLRVSGAVQAIKKGITDKPYVVLWTKNEFEGVHANFESEQGLSGIAVGQHITVRCIGDNVIMGSPMLRDCILD